MNLERIYLDFAATTPLRHDVANAMRNAAAHANYNPSSLHAEGRQAAALLDAARDRAASLLGAERGEIIFTSGGTESNNLAVIGAARACGRGRIATTSIEHHAVHEAFDRLRDEGFQTLVLPVDCDGRLEPQAYTSALPGAALLSVMYANNETGTVQPIAPLAIEARRQGALLHTDAVQAPSWLPLDVGELGVDLLTLSAHKFYGPKGVGLLYARRGVPMAPIGYGGGQEFGRRPGTPNVIGIVGMVCALELAMRERDEAGGRIGALRDRLEAGIRSSIADTHINGSLAHRLPNFLNVSFAGVDSAELLIALDLAGVAVSAGSACTSGSLEPSHVLAAMALEPRWTRGAIRFSLGTRTTGAEIDRVLELLPPLVTKLRRPAGTRGGGWVD